MNTPQLRALTHSFDITGKKFTSSVSPTSGFSASRDTEDLSHAMRFWGTDEAKIISILGNRTSYERKQISDEYEKKCHRELDDDLDDELSGDFCELAVSLAKGPFYTMAMGLYYAMKGAGTNEAVLIEILAGITKSEIKPLKEAYLDVLWEHVNSKTSRTLESDIKAETTGYFRKTLLLILGETTDEVPNATLLQVHEKGVANLINKAQALEDAKRLNQGGSKRPGTSDKEFMSIIACRTPWQLHAISEEYKKLTGVALIDAIKSELTGDFEALLVAIVCYAISRADYFAEQLHYSMSGAGTHDALLMRIILLRSEIDLGSIADAFKARYKKDLASWIEGDTSGDYEKLLIALLGKK